jgi:AraC-like DNA-binding protein
LNRIDQERSKFFRHPSFPDTLLLRASFTRHRYELHTHSTYVVAVVTRGCEGLRVGSRRYVAPVGSIILVNPEEPHDGEAAAEGGWAYRTLYPPTALLARVQEEAGIRGGLPGFRGAVIDDRGLATQFIAAHRLAESQEVADAEASLLIALRTLIDRHADARSARLESANGSSERLKGYRDFIEANLTSPIDLTVLAELASVTRFQVIRDFKRQTGLTPGAYIRQRRQFAAARFIADGLSLAEASAAAGFADQSHLTRVFRSIQGVTPKVFKAAHDRAV